MVGTIALNQRTDNILPVICLPRDCQQIIYSDFPSQKSGRANSWIPSPAPFQEAGEVLRGGSFWAKEVWAVETTLERSLRLLTSTPYFRNGWLGIFSQRHDMLGRPVSNEWLPKISYPWKVATLCVLTRKYSRREGPRAEARPPPGAGEGRGSD